MHGIIMAGGFGTRLRPLTNNLPKPMVPLANRPIIEHILDLLKKHSITELTSLLYFQPERVTEHFGDGSKFGVNMDYTSPSADLGTAGAVAYALREKQTKEPVIIISGDVVTDIDLTAAIEFHKSKKTLVTIVLTRVENPLQFGIVITDDDGRVERFLEKPTWGEVFSDTINTGIYILDPGILDYIPEDKDFDFSKDLFPKLLEDDQPIYGFIAEGYWKDVGSLDEYRLASIDVLSGKAKVTFPGAESSKEGIWIGEGSNVDINSEFDGTVIIGSNCKVEAGVKISDSIVGDNCTLRKDSTIINSVLWDNVTIGKGASLQENVVGSSTGIGSGAHLGEGAIVSDHCKVGRRSTIKANVKLWPYKTVDDDATLASSLIWGQRWAKNIFSAYGITGLANLELSPEFAAKLGAAYGAALRKGSVVSTSRDVHKTSRMINRAVMTGILSSGVNVHDYGVIPIPVVRYLARNGIEIGGIHTRRSPFNLQVVDMKFFDDKGLDLHPNQEKTLERLFFREDFERVGMDETGEITFPVHGYETYETGFMNSIETETIKEAGFKIVLDYSYGSSSRIFPAILGKLNCEVIALNANLDGTKVTKTGPEFDKALKQLSTIVRSLKADLGVLLDSGGEKIFLVDETGEILDADTTLNLVTLLALKSNKAAGREGRIAVPVTASRAIDQMAATYGFEVVRTKTTARGLMEAAADEDIIFVGETSGGFVFPRFNPGFDGMYSIAKILEMLAVQGSKLHKLIREVPPSIMKNERVSCPFENKGMVMRRLAEDTIGEETELIDGIRITLGDDWVAAYPSQDQPYFHVVTEASTEEEAKKLLKTYTGKIKKWQVKDS